MRDTFNFSFCVEPEIFDICDMTNTKAWRACRAVHSLKVK